MSEDEQYIEINPMLCPCSDLLPALFPRLHVIHLVREPLSWVQSITRFKASGVWKYLIDYLPYAVPYPVPRPPGWMRADKYERAFWRWRFCNQRIHSLQKSSASYTLIRYEDLFSENARLRETAFAELIRGLRLPIPDDLAWCLNDERVNASQNPSEAESRIDSRMAAEICGELASRFGYPDLPK